MRGPLGATEKEFPALRAAAFTVILLLREHRALRVSFVLKSFYTTFTSAMRLVPIPDHRDPHVLSLDSHVWLRSKAAPG